MNIQKKYPGWVVFGSLIGLLLFLWVLSALLSWVPAPIGPAAEQFSESTRVTVWLTVVSGTLGILLGVFAGLGRLSPFWPLRWVCDFYVWLFRGTPLLLQITFVWLAVPELLPSSLQFSDFTYACIALAFNMGAYNTECVRAGILAVPAGQIEAARALGLSPLRTFLDITLPQSMRVALPALANNLASLVKDSSLASTISVVELTMIAKRIQATSYQTIPSYLASGLIYLILTTAFTSLTSALETKLDVGRKR